MPRAARRKFYSTVLHMQLSQSTFSLITLTHITQNPSLSGYWYSCTVSVVPPLHLYTCGLTCTPQLHSTVCSSACRRSIGYLGGQCGARSTSDPLQLRVEWWEREFALALGGRLHLQWREAHRDGRRQCSIVSGCMHNLQDPLYRHSRVQAHR